MARRIKSCFPSRALLSALALFLVGGFAPTWAQTQSAPTAAAPLEIISPFRLGISPLTNIDIVDLPPQTLIAAQALRMAADGASASIVLMRTANRNSVHFTASNGATLLPYDSTFLTHKPTQGTTALDVTPVVAGSQFYSLALLQSPPSGAEPHFNAPIVVTAQPLAGQVYTVDLPLTPPPVLLIHGLWGDNSSLSDYQDKLLSAPPWSTHRGSVYILTYSGDLSFDSPLSVGALQTEVGQILSTSRQDGAVVSRIDVIAHSMGGLLIREFSQSSNYRNVRNRNLGALYNIVTLDTPEAGSALASYLIANRKAGLKATLLSDYEAYAFWNTVCGTAANTTVGECLASYNDPVARGAVASLEPNSSELQHAPTPHIPDAIWSAVTATDSSGIVYDGVTLLIRAIYASQSQAPSIYEILGGLNDDIVSLASQLSGAPSPYVTDPGLAHTALLDATVDPAVTNSPLAISQTLCWLQGITLADCPKPAAAVAENVSSPPLAAPGRLTVAPTEAATLGRPLIFHSSIANIRSVEVSQWIVGRTRLRPETPALTPSAEGGVAFSVTPRLPGRVRFDIKANFGDGRFDIVHRYVDVGVPAGRIEALRADSQFQQLTDLDVGAVYFLDPTIEVEGLNKPVEIGGLATYRVVPAAGGVSPITVKPDGTLQAIHPGAATVVVTFEDHSDRLNVTVK